MEGGDVELRIRVTSSNPAATLVSGTIKGTAVHMPDVAPEIFPAADTRVNFGADGRSTLNGVIFPLTPGALTGAFDGIGTGALTVRNGSGDSCGAASFSWGVSAAVRLLVALASLAARRWRGRVTWRDLRRQPGGSVATPRSLRGANPLRLQLQR